MAHAALAPSATVFVERLPLFSSSCQYALAGAPIAGMPDLPLIICGQAGGPGSIRMEILRPAAIAAGQMVPLGGSDPVLTLDLSAVASNHLIESLGAQGTGFVVFDRFELGKIIQGRFVDGAIDVKPDPLFPCRLSGAEFAAVRPIAP
jgi:hypothetical protein